MRVIMVNTRAEAQTVAARIARERVGRPADELEKLNPHIDFTKIEPGTVILVPDRAGPAGGTETAPADDDKNGSVQGQAFDDLRALVTTALESSSARVRSGYDSLANDAKELGALLKSAPMKRAMETDQELKVQSEAALAVFKQDTADAKAAEQSLKSMKERMGEELNALSKLLG